MISAEERFIAAYYAANPYIDNIEESVDDDTPISKVYTSIFSFIFALELEIDVGHEVIPFHEYNSYGYVFLESNSYYGISFQSLHKDQELLVNIFNDSNILYEIQNDIKSFIMNHKEKLNKIRNIKIFI